jgi:hypothetical protein
LRKMRTRFYDRESKRLVLMLAPLAQNSPAILEGKTPMLRSRPLGRNQPERV